MSYTRKLLVSALIILFLYNFKCVYAQEPFLNVQITSPDLTKYKNIEDRVRFEFIVTFNGQKIRDVEATLSINGIESGTDTSNSQGRLEFTKKLTSSDSAEIKLVLEKSGYSKTEYSVIVSNFYKLSFSPDENDIITFEDLILSTGISLNGVGKEGANIKLYLNENYYGEKDTEDNGWATFKISEIQYGKNKYYMTIILDGNVITSEEFNFEVYKDLRISLYKIDASKIVNFVNPEVILKTVSYSHNIIVPNVKISFFVNNNKVAENYSNAEGICELKFTLNDNEISWYVEAYKTDYIAYISKTNVFNLEEQIPVLSGSLIYPQDDSVIEEISDNLAFNVHIMENDDSSEGAKVDFYIENVYAGTAISNENGIATLFYSLPVENKTYTWHYLVSKNIFVEYSSNEKSFYYPKQPPNVIIENIFTAKERADLDSNVIIGFQLKWEDGEVINNTSISLGNGMTVLSNEMGWAYFSVTNQISELKWYNISKIFDSQYSHIVYSNKPRVIWDRVIFVIHSDDTRISVGEPFNYTVSAYHEYDKTNFSGEYKFCEELSSQQVGKKTLKIEEINDSNYGLTSFLTNEIDVIWDRIVFSNKSPVMYSYMDISDLEIEAYYEYDRTEFLGTYNCSLENIASDTKKIIIKDVDEPLYGLNKILIENMDVIYKEFTLDKSIEIIRLGLQEISISLSVITVDNYEIYVNDKKIEGNVNSSEYTTNINDYNLYTKLEIEIYENENMVHKESYTIVNYENILTYFCGVILLTSLLYNIYAMQKPEFDLF